MSRDVAPPSGWPAPQTAALAGRSIALVPLAEATADRYFEEFPEDLDRYGDAARAWEVHDTLHCLHGRCSTSRRSPASSARSRG
jgi:hypothetical protein